MRKNVIAMTGMRPMMRPMMKSVILHNSNIVVVIAVTLMMMMRPMMKNPI